MSEDELFSNKASNVYENIFKNTLFIERNWTF
jgi:hypothetical protein